jgi:hypothetical protein
MTTPAFMIALFYTVDQERLEGPQRPEAKRSPSAVVPWAWRLAITGGGLRAFSRWWTRDSLPLCPPVPERTRWARLFTTPTAWTARLMAAPTVLGVADRDGMALMHPLRDGRRPAQLGTKGQSHPRWRVGGKRCLVLHQWGVMCAWAGAPAHVHDTHLQPLMAQCADTMMLLTETGCQAKTGAPVTRKGCPRGTWNTRMLVETVLSLRTTVCHRKHMGHRVWASCRARVAWTRAVLNLWARWGRERDEHDMIRLSIAEFSL